jgi:hypothetical protein
MLPNAEGSAGPNPGTDLKGEFPGLFRGIGSTSREPCCGKRVSSLGRVHGSAHFAIGCQKWDDNSRLQSRTQEDYTSHGVVYSAMGKIDKNASQADLRQQEHRPDVHYRTENRDRFDHPMGGPPEAIIWAAQRSTLHLGDERPELQTQSQAVHCRQDLEDGHRARAMRAAGQGVMIPNSQWPKPPRVHPVHAGPRSIDSHDLGVANGMRFNKISGNHTTIVYEANARDPILGHHVPLAARAVDHPTTRHQVAEANRSVAPLRSLPALRPGPA